MIFCLVYAVMCSHGFQNFSYFRKGNNCELLLLCMMSESIDGQQI